VGRRATSVWQVVWAHRNLWNLTLFRWKESLLF